MNCPSLSCSKRSACSLAQFDASIPSLKFAPDFPSDLTVIFSNMRKSLGSHSKIQNKHPNKKAPLWKCLRGVNTEALRTSCILGVYQIPRGVVVSTVAQSVAICLRFGFRWSRLISATFAAFFWFTLLKELGPKSQQESPLRFVLVPFTPVPRLLLPGQRMPIGCTCQNTMSTF